MDVVQSENYKVSAVNLLNKIGQKKKKPRSALQRIGFDETNNYDLDRYIRSNKVSVKTLAKLKKELELNDHFLYSLVSISKTTASRREKLTPDEAGRVYRVSYILSLSEEVLGSHERGVRWLKTPAKFLNGSEPIELLKTEAGAEAVKNLLFRIDHSVYA